MDMHRITRDVVTKIVSFPHGGPRPDPGASQPDRETTWMMVAAVVFGGQFPLTIDGPAKLTTPDYERVF